MRYFPIKRFNRGLIFKLGGGLLLLLIIKLMMIGVGIYSAGHLSGDARAINWAGSERMRSYKMALLINKWLDADKEDRAVLQQKINEEIARFDDILKYLREGERGRGQNRYEESDTFLFFMNFNPLFKKFLNLPGIYEPELKIHVEKVHQMWKKEIKPLILGILNPHSIVPPADNYKKFDHLLNSFVDEVDLLVALLEDSSNRKVKLFKRLQYVFLILTLIVTLMALYVIFLVTKKSVHGLMEGIRAMTASDFSKRVSIISKDEMGELAVGFNFMAEKLEELYGNLEGKVKEKTVALEQRNRELSILYDMVASLNKSLPIDELLDIFLTKLKDYLGIHSSAIRLVDEDGSVRLAASIGLDDGFKSNIAFGECLCGTLVQDEPRLPWELKVVPKEMRFMDCKDCSYRTVVEIPINYRGKLLGLVNLFQNEIREFSDQEKLLAESLNNHLGAAIEYYNLDVKTRKLAIIEERNMLASELHDSIAQALAYLKIQGSLLEGSIKARDYEQALEDLAQIRKGIEKSNADVRELLVHFRTKIDSEGIESTIKKFLSRFRRETGIKTVFRADSDIPPLSPGAEVHLFHIVQEALTNARKYSEATEVKVTVRGNGNFGVTVEDNGKGFCFEEVKLRGPSHVGIDIMKERAIRLGGELSVESKIGNGTCVSLKMC
ncbi:MAG: histidine kinase [Deltaproteobacteria bacterium]|nr:histidine kinase [Deltaproteobacteria bacterium]